MNKCYAVECVFTISGACSDLPLLMNGDITYEAGVVDSRPINTIATFTCDNGYSLTGGSFRVCQNDGTWSGTVPTCQCELIPLHLNSCFTFLDTVNIPTDPPPTTCPDLTVPPNGMVRGTANPRPVGTVATYTCNTGYTLNGGSTRTCRANGTWSGSAPVCQCK